MKLSVVIIAKNSAKIIEDCIKSVSFAEEIIVVDGGSTDSTKEIAQKLKAKVISGVAYDFAKQRNIGKTHAKGEWIFYVDTDERVTPELGKSIQQAIELPKFDAYKIKRKNFYLGNFPWPGTEKLERLFRRSHLKQWVGALHESPVVEGTIGELNGFLLHYSHQSLSSMVSKTNQWSEIEADLRFKSNHPKMSWWRFYRVMYTGFYDSYIKQGGFKAGTPGLIESVYQAFSMFITYAKLWERQHEKNTK